MAEDTFRPDSEPELELLQQGESFVLLQTPDLKEAGDVLLSGRHDTWELLYMDNDNIQHAIYIGVDGLQRVDEPDGIERFVITGAKFPDLKRITARIELEVPTQDESFPHVSFVTFYEA